MVAGIAAAGAVAGLRVRLKERSSPSRLPRLPSWTTWTERSER